MIKSINKRKAITPVLSIVLLVMLMVGLIGGAYVFITSLTSKSNEVSEKVMAKQIESSKTILRVSSIWDDTPSDGYFNVSITNAGPDPLASSIVDSAKAYIDNKPIGSGRVGSGDILPGREFKMYISADQAPNKGKLLKITFGNGAEVMTTIP